MVRNRNNNIWKILKDYAVPFIGFLLIIVLLYSVFSWSNEEKTPLNDTNNVESLDISEVNVQLLWEDAKAYVIYDNWKKVEIKESISLWKAEKVSVESGEVNIDFPFLAKMRLSKNGELSYNEDWSLTLDSAKLWIEALKDMDISMKYANVSIPAWSIVSLNQNEVESSIYSLNDNVTVSNLAWINFDVKSGEKIDVLAKNSTSTDVDFSSMKKPIDDYFKLSKWFIENDWEKLLLDDKDNINSSWSLDSKSWSLLKENTSDLLTFDDVTDESYAKSNPIDLKWRYNPLDVSKVTINNKEVSLNKDLWIFSLNWFVLDNKVNDLIIKIYDNNSNIIWKRVITLYSSSSSKPWAIIIQNKVNSKLESFSVKPTDFIIYEPSKTWKFTTTSTQVTLRGKVLNTKVDSVLVNDYKLKSYNGSTWRYHAFVEQWTLKDWINNYEIKYLDKDWKTIYKEYYSIYKETQKIEKAEKKEIISDEVKIKE